MYIDVTSIYIDIYIWYRVGFADVEAARTRRRSRAYFLLASALNTLLFELAPRGMRGLLRMVSVRSSPWMFVRSLCTDTTQPNPTEELYTFKTTPRLGE